MDFEELDEEVRQESALSNMRNILYDIIDAKNNLPIKKITATLKQSATYYIEFITSLREAGFIVCFLDTINNQQKISISWNNNNDLPHNLRNCSVCGQEFKTTYNHEDPLICKKGCNIFSHIIKDNK
jgi:hypothetical protein